jgi:hypothetical protein
MVLLLLLLLLLLLNMRSMTQTGGYLIFVHRQNNERKIVTPYSTDEESGKVGTAFWDSEKIF